MKKYIFFFFLIFLFYSCQNKVNQSRDKLVTNEEATKLDSLFTKLYGTGKFNGNVLVAEKGNPIFIGNYGMANEATKTKIDKNTKFKLASLSKQFTAMGIVLLQKENKLSYDDDFTKYIPELSHYKGITIKNLLIHTSGLPDYMELADEHWDKSKIAANEDIIDLYKKFHPKIEFKTNQKWEYSNTGYLLLASIIERITGESYGAYLKHKIFKPLKMNSTMVYRKWYQPQKIKNYAEGYYYSDSLDRKITPDEINNHYNVYLDGIIGDGGITSTLEDLLKWDRALFRNKLINEEDRKLIFSSFHTKDGKDTDYGFGWFINDEEPYGKIVFHSGGWAGYITYIERHLENDKTIIILQNNSTEKTEIPIKNTRRILYGLPMEKIVKLNAELLKKYAGKYITENGKEREVILKNDKLWIPLPFNPKVKLELIPHSKTKFIVDKFSPEVSYTFTVDENGYATEFRVQQQGKEIDNATRKE